MQVVRLPSGPTPPARPPASSLTLPVSTWVLDVVSLRAEDLVDDIGPHLVPAALCLGAPAVPSPSMPRPQRLIVCRLVLVHPQLRTTRPVKSPPRVSTQHPTAADVTELTLGGLTRLGKRLPRHLSRAQRDGEGRSRRVPSPHFLPHVWLRQHRGARRCRCSLQGFCQHLLTLGLLGAAKQSGQVVWPCWL